MVSVLILDKTKIVDTDDSLSLYSLVFAGPLSPGVVIIGKSCATNISANVN